MARFNEILVGRYNRFLQKFLGMKGGPPSPQLASEISPQIQLDDADRMENRFVASVRSWANAATSPAVVAAFSAFRLSNPVNSGVIITVEKAFVSSSLATSAVLTLLLVGPFPGPVNGTPRDSRLAAQLEGSVGQISSSSAAANTGSTLVLVTEAANSTVDGILHEHQEITISPGYSVTWWNLVLNQAFNAGFFWRERPEEEGEVKA